jgi:hypothetical protein
MDVAQIVDYHEANWADVNPRNCRWSMPTAACCDLLATYGCDEDGDGAVNPLVAESCGVMGTSARRLNLGRNVAVQPGS